MARSSLALVTVALSALVACSSAPKVPVVDSVTVPTLTKAADGTSSGVFVVAAHGDGSAVSQLSMHIPLQNGTAFADTTGSVAGVASPYSIKITFPAAAGSGTYNFQVTAIDAAGVSSSPFPSSFTLP